MVGNRDDMLEKARIDAERRQKMADELKIKPPSEKEMEKIRELKRQEDQEKDNRRVQ